MKLEIPQASDSLIAKRARPRRMFLLALVLVSMAAPVLAAASLTVQIMGSGYTAGGQAPQDGAKIGAGETVTIMLTVTNGKVSQAIRLPHVDGLVVNGSGTNPGAHSESFTFFVTPTRAGDITIPAFDIRTDEGQTLHVNAIKLRVAGP